MIFLDCECLTCKTYTKSYLYQIVREEEVACHLISIHNLYYLLNLMKQVIIKIKCLNYYLNLFLKNY
jgi:queuine tRNA-ribosyltransferase catalytic subunit